MKVKPINIIKRMNGYSAECPLCGGKTLKMKFCQKCGVAFDWDIKEDDLK